MSTSIIRQLREKEGITQEALAKKLGISRPTLVNIEKGKRELSMSQIILLSKLFQQPYDVFIHNECRLEPPFTITPTSDEDQSDGAEDIRIHIPQKNIDKFKEVLLYLLSEVGARPNVGQTVLYKLLYFIDFDYYEKYEQQLMGAVYIKNHYGPTPLAFESVISTMVNDDELEVVKSQYFGYEQTKYLPHREANLDVLSAKELGHIQEVVARLSHLSAKELSDLSHKDVPWIVTKESQPIEYESVFYRSNETSVRHYD